jgi:GTP-binding protein HflX
VDRAVDADAAADLAETLSRLRDLYPDLVPVSALTGAALAELLAAVDEELTVHLVTVEALIPYSAGNVLNLVHTQGLVDEEEYVAGGTRIVARVPRFVLGALDPFLAGSAAG